MPILPVGKLPPEIADKIVKRAPILDNRVLIGPGTGLDCAVVNMGDNLLVIKSDPITFATEQIGWYAVQINANDIATTGAIPKWMSATILLPENRTDEHLLNSITDQIFQACVEFGISFIGGHTEITHSLHRPIIAATLLGEVASNRLLSPANIQDGDYLLLIKSLAIETTAIIAHDFTDRCSQFLTHEDIKSAQNYLNDPGISVYREARLLAEMSGTHAMHDPTEGGLSAALWEMAIASEKRLVIDESRVVVSDLSQKICSEFKIEIWETISSGALLAAVEASSADLICEQLIMQKIPCANIGKFEAGDPIVVAKTKDGHKTINRPARDAISRLF